MSLVVEMVELLLKRGASLEPEDSHSHSVLTSHVYHCRLDVCEAILKRFPNTVSYKSSVPGSTCTGYSPLHHASWRGSLDAVDLLLKYSADCHMITDDGNTCLGLACHVDSFACVKRFIDLKCDPNVLDKDNDTALIYATFNGNSEVVQLLLENGANPHMNNLVGVTPLWNAIYSRSLNIVQQLLRLNVDCTVASRGFDIHAVNHIYDEKVSPLFVAIHHQEISIVKALFDAGHFIHQEFQSVNKSNSVYLNGWADDNKRWLHHVTRSTPSLSWWCKRTIREHIQCDFQNSVRKLPVSSLMKSYIVGVS